MLERKSGVSTESLENCPKITFWHCLKSITIIIWIEMCFFVKYPKIILGSYSSFLSHLFAISLLIRTPTREWRKDGPSIQSTILLISITCWIFIWQRGQKIFLKLDMWILCEFHFSILFWSSISRTPERWLFLFLCDQIIWRENVYVTQEYLYENMFRKCYSPTTFWGN